MVSKEQIDAWKAKYGAVFKCTVGEDEYYYRYLNRKEYRDLLKEQQTVNDASVMDQILEQKVIGLCLLSPDPAKIDFDKMPAGISPLISEEIMKVSGFTNAVSSEKL